MCGSACVFFFLLFCISHCVCSGVWPAPGRQRASLWSQTGGGERQREKEKSAFDRVLFGRRC